MIKNHSWWSLSLEELPSQLHTDLQQGLSLEQVPAKRFQSGYNELIEKRKDSYLKKFLEQFNNVVVWILIVAAFISGFLKEWIDAIAILVIVILNAAIGFIQEFRAEKALAALRQMAAPSCKVFRQGQIQMIPSKELVIGDIVLLEAGDYVPADIRLTQSNLLKTQEAALTGESVPVEKSVDVILSPNVSIGDRKNMCFMGTSVVSGKGRGVVIEIGMGTELGKIAQMLQETGVDETPLQKRLEKLGQWLVYFCLGVVGIVFITGLFRGEKIMDMFLTSVSLAVAAVPEGLPAIVTIALAMGVQRMVKRHALIRKLPSVETLGCAMVICSDKTGTLTQNQMTVKKVYIPGQFFEITGTGYAPEGKFLQGSQEMNEPSLGLKNILEASVLCNGARLKQNEKQWSVIGDPTEGAMLTVALKLGIDKEKIDLLYPTITEIPFDSDRKMMTTLHERDGRFLSYSKGAPDVLIQKCTHIWDGQNERLINEEDLKKIHETNETWTQEALRILAIAQKNLKGADKDHFNSETAENGLTFLGLVAMIDPPRAEVKEAIVKCKKAGIRTVMITGDHKNTAIAIARELGMFEEDLMALSGVELDQMSDSALENKVEQVCVYARVSAEHKLRVVRAWRKRGKVVAMTGDGVNDAPAVKEADIGIAMGITGTDVTKEASDMVVTDDNFASIVAAVEEGRGIYTNIKKSIYYLLSCNTGEILVMFLASLFGLPMPLFPIQILWMNIATDGLPAIALGMDPIEKGIMEEPPRSREEGIINRAFIIRMLFQGFLIAACVLIAFLYVLYIEKADLARARGVAFSVLVLAQLFHSFNCRSEKTSIFKLGLFSNQKLVLASLVALGLQICIIYVPFLEVIFKTERLSLFDWMLCVGVSSVPVVGVEIYKKISFRKGVTR